MDTPDLNQLLQRLRRRLATQVWLHGLGRTLTFAAAWLLFVFLADWLLHVPAPVRLFHLVVLLALPLFVFQRELVRRLRRVPDQDGLAVLVERAHPDLHELLVSAVQLGRRGPTEDESGELVARVVAQAEERARTLDLTASVDPRAPRRAFGLGLALALACAIVLGMNGAASGIFFKRLGGGTTPWPQRTHLHVEIPIAGGRAQVETDEEEIRVRVARGGDVPVLVRAEGVVPDEVVLHFGGGQETALASAGGPVFRQLLRAVQEDVEFYVTGGDDEDGLPVVRITVLQPPDVAGLAVRIEPPAYTGLAARLEHDRDVQVIAGSVLQVHVLPDPPDARGMARILPMDRVVTLEPAPFPPPEDAPASEGEGEAPAGLAFELTAEADLRYRFELVDDSGLSNPDPGLFAIQVIEDRPPEIDLIAPGRVEAETVVGGTLPLRVRVTDDFGLAGIELLARSPGAAADEERRSGLAWRTTELSEREKSRARAAGFAARRLELTELLGGAAPDEGQLIELEVRARDTREPEPLEGRSIAVRLRVVSADEFLRRLQDRLSRARAEVGTLSELMQEKHRRTLELVASLESDQPGVAARPDEIGAVVTGQRRVRGDARALARELSAVAESLLYSRLDDRAGALLEELDRRLAEIEDRSFQPEIWSELARMEQAGQLGKAVFASKLVQIAGLAIEISEEGTARATDELRRAQDATDLTLTHEALVTASELQARAMADADRLLELLAEWDNFQSVLSLTRDILNRQKNLLERTRQYAKEN